MADKTKTKKEVKFRHGSSLALLAAVMFGCVVGLGSEPQIPMVAGCAIAGGIAMYLGNSWEEVLSGAMKGVLDAMEAVLILMCIGMLVGTWILSGTVPTLIYYGLSVISPELFLPVAFKRSRWALCWDRGALLGTIGTAFIARRRANISLAWRRVPSLLLLCGARSPASTDGPVLCAAIADVSVFSLCKKFLPIVIAVCLVSVGLYFFIGNTLGTGMTEAGASQVDELLSALDQSYAIGPVTLIPLVVMIACIVMQVPAIPSFLPVCFWPLSKRCCCRGPTQRCREGGEYRRGDRDGLRGARQPVLYRRHRRDAADHFHRDSGHGLCGHPPAHGPHAVAHRTHYVEA